MSHPLWPDRRTIPSVDGPVSIGNDEILAIRIVCAKMVRQAIKDLCEEIVKNRKVCSVQAVMDGSEPGSWIFGNHGQLSFEACCEVLEIDPSAVRYKIRRDWREILSADSRFKTVDV